MYISKFNNNFLHFLINQIIKLLYYITVKHDPYTIIQFFVP